MGESYGVAAGVQHDIIRLLFSSLDRPLYGFLGLVYQLFFNVASADLFSNDTMMKFYGRVQLILGVFMMFHLAMVILKGIMNPDSFTDSKSGAGNLIMRIVTALFLLSTLVPISIPSPKNEYEIQINNNGLLFGTLYSLQHRLLSNNTLGRLILGTDGTTDNYVSLDSSDEENLESSARIFTSTILKGFYRINLLPEEERNDIAECRDATDPATKNACRMCQSGVDDQINAYKKLDAEPDEIIAMVNEKCDFDSSLLNVIPGYSYVTGNERYVFTYSPFISTVTAIVFVFILLSFTIDVAVRAVKLAVLRLIAPIPIITYMDPKGSKDNAFNSWVKTLTSTYLDLFLRLAIVYFVLFLIQDMMVNGIVIKHGTGILGVFSLIIIWIGLFIFAKQAPKFIKQVLGIKDDGFKLFGGLGEALSIGAVGAGAISGAVSGVASGKGAVGKVAGGLGGVLGGGYNAGKAYLTGKDAKPSTIMNANRAYAQRKYANAADDSTFGGRLLAGAQANLGLKNDYQKMEDKIARYQRAEGAWKSVQNALDSDGWVAKDPSGAKNAANHRARGGYVHGGAAFTAAGETILNANEAYSIKELKDIQARMKSSGRYTAGELEQMEGFVKSAEKSRFDYIRKQSKTSLETPRERQILEGATQIMQTAGKHFSDKDGVWADFSGHIDVADAFYDGQMATTFKGASFAAGAEATELKSSAEYAQAKANAQRVQDSQKK